MRATAWHNGMDPQSPAGYGILFSAADRDRAFDRGWDDVVLDLDGSGQVTVALTPSFWRKCSELRSSDIGRWLLEQHVAPCPRGAPPGIAVNHVAENRFTARVLKRYNLL